MATHTHTILSYQTNEPIEHVMHTIFNSYHYVIYCIQHRWVCSICVWRTKMSATPTLYMHKNAPMCLSTASRNRVWILIDTFKCRWTPESMTFKHQVTKILTCLVHRTVYFSWYHHNSSTCICKTHRTWNTT